jgi:hypothetical protein
MARAKKGGAAAALALAAIAFLARPASGADTQRVIVRVTDPASRALMQRIRGQTSDLDQQISEVAQPPMEPRISDELASARRLAARSDARVVVWFDTTGESLTLFFSVPREGRTLVRTMEQESPTASATLEAAALVVRSVLRALASGATIGVTLAKPLDVPAAPETASEQPSAPPPQVSPAPPVPEDRWGWVVSAGWHATLDGPGTWLQGVEARAGARHGIWSAGLQAALDAPTQLSDPYATVRLSRGTAVAFVALAIPTSDALHLALSMGVGAAGFPRQSLEVASGVTRAPDSWNTSAVFATDLGASYRMHWQGAVWAIALRAGADLVVSPPTIGYEVGGAFIAEHALWNVQPKAVLALEVATF